MTNINREELMSKFEENLDAVITLNDVVEKLPERNQEFANDLVHNFSNSGSLSPKQMSWVHKFVDMIKGIEPVYGDFKAVVGLLKVAAIKGKLKYPKIRLLSKEGKFIQLNWNKDEEKIKVFVDGWQGHGYRKYAGVIENDLMKPYLNDRMTDDVKLTLQEFSLDPIKASKAASSLLGCCPYCGGRLTDERSKQAGYGPTCAKHYELPWG